MKIYQEISLKDFEFWGGARDIAKWFTDEQLEYIESIIEDIFGVDAISETTINDLFWFEEDMLAEWLGAPSFEDIRWTNELNGHEPSWKYED